ncbi:MAG: FG-GAP-like repeat-containing protein [Ignavibacteriales bacterium]|nr:FG-GAP-like repeat-containing protein [Ignavibacteriales bacterium]
METSLQNSTTLKMKTGNLVKRNLSDRLKRSESLKGTLTRFSLLLLLFTFFSQVALSQINWQQTNGPYGGIVRALAVSGSNLFAGTEGGGVFLSTDNGTSWSAVNTGLTSMYIYDLAISGMNLFAATDGGVFLSTNNGTNWNYYNTGLPNTLVFSFAISGTNIFAGTLNGVFLSTNNGLIWSEVNNGLTDKYVNDIVITGTNIFAGTNNGGIFLSTNNGASWTAVNSGLSILPGTGVYALVASGSNIFAGTWSGVFLSTNNGASWSAVNTGLTSTIIKALAMSGTNLFAGTTEGGVFLSTNNGATWSTASSGMSNTTVICLAVNPASGGSLFAGTLGSGVFLSTNNGGTWNAINGGLNAYKVTALLVKPAENGVGNPYLFAGTEYGGVFLSTDKGSNWTEVNSGLSGLANSQILSLAISGEYILAGTSGGLFLSTNNGSNWIAIKSGIPGIPINTLYANGANVFAGTGANGAFRSTNNGLSWSAINIGTSNLLVYDFIVSGTNLFAGTWEGIFISTDNGTSWSGANSGLTNTQVRCFATIGTNLFAGTNAGGVFLSTNNGLNWNATGSALNAIPIESLFADGTNLFAGTVSSGIYLSSNNGSSWAAVNTGMASKLILAFATIEHGLYAGTVNGLFVSALPGPYPLTITSFTPTSGPIGTTVTITGTNFNTTASNNIVYFGAVKATVTAATSTSLSVIVPTGATYAPITVTDTTTHLLVVSRIPFTPTFTGSPTIDANSFAAKVDFATGANPHHVSVSDVDGDGKPDIILTNYDGNTISVLRNTSTSGTVSFAAKVDYATGISPYEVSIGDVDGDGKPDIIVTNWASNTVSVLRNTCTSGTISFAAKVDFATGSAPRGVSIGDVDKDGKLDIIATNWSGNTVSVLRNTCTSGTVSFATKVDFATGAAPLGVSMGDVDGDGNPDIVIANGSSNTVSVLRNSSTNGAVSFAAKVDFATVTNPYGISIGDVDGDGNPDIVVANWTVASVSVLRNTSTTGSISFATKVDFAIGAGSYGVSIGDMNGDGNPDIVVTNNTSATVSVLRNTSTTGAVSFAAKSDYTTGSGVLGVSTCDMDGDGKPDIVAANGINNTVSVLRNTVGRSDGLVAWYPFNGNANDESGNGNNGTVNGATLTTDRLGNLNNAYSLNGSGDWIDIGNTTLCGNSHQLTLSCWAKSPSLASVGAALIQRADDRYLGGTATRVFRLEVTPTGQIGFGVNNIPPSNGVGVLSQAGSFQYDNYWRHIVATYDDVQGCKIYLNGIKIVDTILTFGTVSNLSIRTAIGIKYNSIPSQWFKGVLDDIRIYNRALSETEINSLYHEGGWTSNTAPAIPQNLTAIAGNGQVTLKWSKNTESDFLRYRIYRGTSSGPTIVSDSTTAGISDTSKVITGLTNGTMYYFRITAVDSARLESAYSNEVNTTPSVLNAQREYNPDANTVLLMHMDEAAGSSVSDASSFGNNGTASAGAKITESGRFGGARSFDGSQNAQIEIMNFKNLTFGTQDFTAEVWINTTSTNFSQPYIEHGWGPVKYWRLGIADGFPIFTMSNSGNGISLSSFVKLNDGRWHHLAVVKKEGVAYLYADGMLQAQNDISSFGNIDSLGGSFLIGESAFSVNTILDEVRISKIARSPKEFDIQLPPVNLAITVNGTTASLNWQNGGGALPLMRYKIYRGADSTNVALVDSTTSTSRTQSGLVTGLYYYRVSAVDSTGFEGAKSFAVKATISGASSPPIIIGYSPGCNRIDVLKNATIAVTFDKDIDQATISSSSICINGTQSGKHIFTQNYNSSTKTLTLYPDVQFRVGEIITVTATRRIKNLSGDSFAHALTWSFTIKTNTASGIFTQTSTPGVGNDPQSVVAGDFDRDGDIDLAVANNTSNTVSILLNNGSGTFIQSSTPAVGYTPNSITAGDFDGDGDLDLAVVNNVSGTISILLNNGSGIFTKSSTVSVGSDPKSVTAGDFDGDGDIDLAVANYSSNSVSILLNNGSGIFTQTSTPAVGNNPQSVTAGDFDGDGDIDLAVANSNSNTVSILLNNGSGTFTQSSTTGVGPVPWSITSGDFNGDGYLDLAVTNDGNPNTVSILLNNGSGTFILSSSLSVGGTPRSITASDLDGDGDIDLAVACNYGSNIAAIFINNGSGTFTQSFRPGVGGSTPCSITAVDFDGNGTIDLASVNSISNTVIILSNGSITPTTLLGEYATDANTVLLMHMDEAAGSTVYDASTNANNGMATGTSVVEGRFGKARYFDGGANYIDVPNSATIDFPSGAFTCEMWLNVATATSRTFLRKHGGEGYMFYMDYSGRVYAQINATTGMVQLVSSSSVADGKWHHISAVKTLTGGKLYVDGILVSILAANLSNASNTQSLTFGSVPDNQGFLGAIDEIRISNKERMPQEFNLQLPPKNLVANASGATVNLSWQNGGGAVPLMRYKIYRGADSTNLSVIDSTAQLLYTNSSLVVGNSYYYRVSAVDSTGFEGAKSFAVKATISGVVLPPTITSFTPTSGPIGTTVTITGTNFNTTAANNIVYFGAVKATVTAVTSTELRVTVPTGATYEPITVTDLTNGLIACSTNPFIVTFSSGGNITSSSFAAKVDFATGSGPHDVKIYDLDGDGKPDISVVNWNDNTFSLYRNTSVSGSVTTSSFANRVDFLMGNTVGDGVSCDAGIGDLDGDGKPDLSVTNVQGNVVSVFRNISTIGSIGNNSFANKVDFATDINPGTVTIGDLDGDGKPDLVVTNWSSNTISILKNTSTKGGVSFAPKVSLSTGINPWSVKICDLDGDGRPDLIVTNNGSNTISVFRNISVNGSITNSSFAAKVDFLTGNMPGGFSIGDLDGDGKPDLALVNKNDSTVSVFRNTSSNGNISFAPRIDYAASNSPRIVVIGDLDGDGKLDLAVANSGSNTISIYRNMSTNGNISFAPKVDFAAGGNPERVVIGDVDGDGKPDLVVSNPGDNTLSILRNTIGIGTPPPIPTGLWVDDDQPTSFMVHWNSASGATGYRLDVATNIGFTTFVTGFNNRDIGNDTSYSITGLSANTLYYYRVRAYNTGGTSASSNISSVLTALYAPTATAATNVLQTSFTANWISVAGATWYGLYVATDNNYSIFFSDYNEKNIGNVVTYVVTGLNAGTTYYYRVVAHFNGGSSPVSNSITVTTSSGGTAPNAPTATLATTIQQTSFAANWNSVTSATGYRLDVATNSEFTAFVTGFNDRDVANVTACSVTGLIEGTTYYYRVRAYNTGGTSVSSNVITVTTSPAPPAAPTAMSATNVVQTSITANWNAITGATGYRFDVATDNLFTAFVAGFNDKDAANVTSYSITGLNANTTYYYRVRAYNASGTSASSNIITVTTLQNAPSAPSNLTASATSGSQIDLSWTDASNNEDGFKVERKLGAGGSYALIATLGANVQSYSSTGLAEMTTYYYRVYAYNTGGNSGYSNEANAVTKDVTPPSAPTAVQIAPSGWTNQNTFNITWTNPSDPSGIAKLWYIIDTIPTTSSPGKAVVTSTQTLQINISSAGTHQIYLYLEDGTGNKDPNNRAKIAAKYDDVAPVIQHDSTAVANFETASPQAIIIQATAADGVSGQKSLQLLYRRAGVSWSTAQSANYPSVSGGTLNIPASFISSNSLFGVDYRIVATDSADNVAYTPTHSLVIHYSTTVTRSDQSGNPVAQASAGSLPSGAPTEYAYRMFSVPLILDNKTPQDLLENRSGLGSYDEKKWRFFRLNANDQFEEYSTFATQQTIDPGKAFFLILKDAITIKSGPGTVPKSEDINKNGIALKAGYNAIGNPFNFDVPIDSLILATGELLKNKTVWAYVGVGGTNGGWKLSPTTLKAWEGIVANIGNSGPTILRFNVADRPHTVVRPPNASIFKKELAGTTTKENSWSLRIRAEREDNKIDDIENIIGVDPNADDDIDTLDVFEPPLLGDKSISLSFNSKEGALTHDYRSPGAEGYVWDFKLLTPDENAKTVLTFDGIESLHMDRYLIDVESKMVHRLIEKQQLMMNTGKGTKNFRLIIGSKSFAEANSMGIDLFPKEYVLYQNYPNPFNPSTMIRFSLPARSHVKLMIYDLLGRGVVTVVDREMSEGYQEVEWRASVSTGIYFYRLETFSVDDPGRRFADVKKMVLMK